MRRGPTWDPYTVNADPCGTHVLFRRGPHTIQAGLTWNPRTMYCSCGPPWAPRTVQVGPYHSSGTHVLFSWDSRILFRGTHRGSLYLYLKIQNIFNYSLYINIIARLCILRSHAVALLLFELCFHFISSKNIIELFIHR